MDAIEMLLTRRSIRKFKTDEVPKDLLEKIIECAKTSPTGMNKQERHLLLWLKKMIYKDWLPPLQNHLIEMIIIYIMQRPWS